MNDLHLLLDRFAPPSAARGPALDAAVGALVDEAHAASAPRRRWLRKPWTVRGIVLSAGARAGGAAYGATVVAGGDAWGTLTVEAESTATRFGWRTTLPDGTRRVERLTGFALADAQIVVVEDALADPQRLLELDDGAVRDDVLAVYDSSDSQQDIAGRDTCESWVDAGYQAVADLDTTAGRGDLTDDELGDIPGSAENEVFLHSSMRIVTDGITALGVDAMREHGSDVPRYLQRRSPDAAADLLGPTMLVAWRRKDDAPAEEGRLRPWLFGIARMCLRGHHRDESRRLRPTERIRALAPVPTASDDALALDVRAAIGRLPESRRELVELVHWEGLSLAEAATVVGCDASTARSRYAKARATLETALASAVCEVP